MSTGEAVLLLHGQPGGAADWAQVIADLPAGVDAVAVDRPGWDGRRRAEDLEGNARAALAELDVRGVQRAVVVGHSLGGAIAAWLAAEHPERVSALVLVAPAANLASLYPVDRWLAAPIAAEVSASVALAGVGLVLCIGPVRERIAARTGLPGGYLRTMRRSILHPASWLAYAAEQRALVQGLPALQARLDSIVAPTTIVSGGLDRVVPPRAAQELADQIPGARLVVEPTAGHMLPQREPAIVAGAIRDALAAGASG